MSWGEIHARVNPNFKGTLSYTQFPTRKMLDEACLAFENGPVMVRAGRFRTAFGFSNWSELFYTGINHAPLIRSQPLAPGLRLLRDDTGVEVTEAGPWVQIQAALVDTSPSQFELSPTQLRAASLRVQSAFGPLILGLDALPSLRGDSSVYGLDARWTSPRFLVRAEYMRGVGDGATASGYYADVAYRIPRVQRTQFVVRTELLDRSVGGEYRLHTVGLRYIYSPNFTIAGNYGWGDGSAPLSVSKSGSLGWSLRTLFQVHF
jgi:hypothetical protein